MKQVNLRLPEELYKQIERDRGDVPRNRYIREVLQENLERIARWRDGIEAAEERTQERVEHEKPGSPQGIPGDLTAGQERAEAFRKARRRAA